jgi:hypothetical protein
MPPPIRTVFDICTPRDDVRQGAIRESEFAADLAKVLRGNAAEEYLQPDLFFANTHPTDGLKALLTNVFQRVSGRGGEASAIFRLDTQYGGGKTHALIALAHVAAGARGVANIGEFLDPGLVPRTPVRVAAFDGENADPTNGRQLDDGVRAFTPWRVGVRPWEEAWLRTPPRERRAAHGARRRDDCRAVRRPAGADPAG